MEKEISFDQLPQAVSILNDKLDNIERLLTKKNSHKSTENTDQLLTVNQAAEFLNLTVPTIYSKVSKSELPVMKRSKRLYFSRKELMEYLKKGRRRTNSEIEDDARSHILKIQ